MTRRSVFGCPICYRGGWPSSGIVNWSKGGTSSSKLCSEHLEEKRAACRAAYRARKREQLTEVLSSLRATSAKGESLLFAASLDTTGITATDSAAIGAFDAASGGEKSHE